VPFPSSPPRRFFVLCACAASVLSADEALAASYVDGGSTAGACSDGRSAAQASSPATPWCTLDHAVHAAPAGGEILLRGGDHGSLEIQGRHNVSLVTIRSAPGENAQISSMRIQDASGWRIAGLRATSSAATSSVMLAHDIQIANNDFSPRGLLLRAVRNTVVEGNNIHDIQRDPAGKAAAPDGYGIWANGYWNGTDLDGIDNLVIRGNRFANIPQDGIQLGGGVDRVRNVAIERNEFTGVKRRVQADHSDALQILGGRSVAIRANVFRVSESSILVKDDVSEGLVVENNLVIGSDISGIQVQLWDTPGARVVNNTIWGSRPGWPGLRFADLTTCCGMPSGIVLLNNIVDHFAEGNEAWFSAEDHNLFAEGPQRGAHDIDAAPIFTGDYELAPNSPGIDAGTSSGTPAADRLGRPPVDDPAIPNRGSGSPPTKDLGAHERQQPVAQLPSSGPGRPRSGNKRGGHPGRLMVSRRASRRHAWPLKGAKLHGRVAIFLKVRGVRKVRFFLDGRRVQTERNPPFDLRGGGRRAKRLDTRRLGNGRHRLVARVVHNRGANASTRGARSKVKAVFTVRNRRR
jgi:hypothetical protein